MRGVIAADFWYSTRVVGNKQDAAAVAKWKTYRKLRRQDHFLSAPNRFTPSGQAPTKIVHHAYMFPPPGSDFSP